MTILQYIVKRNSIKEENLLLLEQIKLKYPDHTFFVSVIDNDYVIVRRVCGQSKFYRDDKTFFYVDIISQEKLHHEELKYLL